MAKRFTDTNKWAKQSFGDLSLKMKLVWIYLCDNCDHAGIWDTNFKLMAFHLGESVTPDELTVAFGDKIRWLGTTKLFLPSFVEFQYGALNPENRAHLSVIHRLEKEGATKGLKRSLQGRKVTVTDKDKDKDKESAVNFETAEDLAFSLPKKLRDQWAKRYDSEWLFTETQKCFEYYTHVKPEKKPKTQKGWTRVVSGWVGRSKDPKPPGKAMAGSISGVAK